MISYPDTPNPGTTQHCSFIPAHLPLPDSSCRAFEAAQPLLLHGLPGGQGPARHRDHPVPHRVWRDTAPGMGVCVGRGSNCNSLIASTEKSMLEM